MSEQLSNSSLRATIILAALLMASVIVGSFAVNYWSAKSVQRLEHYTYAVKNLEGTLQGLETELSLQSNSDNKGKYYSAAQKDFHTSLAVFSALRFYDEGVVSFSSEAEIDAALGVFIDEFGIDIEAAAVQVGIAGLKMPMTLNEIWGDNGKSENGSASVESSIAEALLLVGPLFQQRIPTTEEANLISAFIDEMQEEIRPLMNDMNTRLDALIIDNSSKTLRTQAAIAFAGCLIVLFITFGIFFPLEKRILANNLSLDRSRQRAEAADRAKSEFLANMSHEIRTPMNGVMGMAELLSRTELSAKQKNFADVIMSSGNALITVINDILDFSKIDSGQLTLDTQPFNLKAVVEDVASLVSTNVDSKELELIIRFHPKMPEEYVGDDGRVRQILMNMVGNAVKFTDAGHILINVSGSEHGDEAELNIRIEDTGIGIPTNKIDSVFDKFNQIDNSATRKFEGTGLGLAICKMLVEKMDGEIGAESELGRGSTFWFKIKLPVHASGMRKRRLPQDITGSRVLIIDDNKVNRDILTEQLDSWGMQSVACSSARQGLSTLAESIRIHSPFDLIIMDYQMPEMDGFEATRRIRADEDIKGTPIIMLTSVCTESDAAEYRSIGIQAQLLKPARSSLLFETIVDVISDAHVEKLKNVVKADPKFVEERPQPMDNAETTSDATAGTKILVAEDNDVNQYVIAEILESLGHDHRVAADGRIAIDLMPEYLPDIILMDVSMPVMNGLEATEEIRKRDAENGTHTIIIGLTANALKGDREKCLDAGMDDYLSKPVDIDQLETCIDKWLNQKKQPGASAAG